MKWQTALLFMGLFLLVAAFCLLIETPFSETPLLKPVDKPQVKAEVPVTAAAKPVAPKSSVRVIPAEPKSVSKQLLELLPDDKLEWLQIQNLEQRKTVTLAAQSDQWVLKFPVQAAASAAKVNEILQALLRTEKMNEMEPEKDWEEYGLARPRIKVGIETRKTSRRYLFLGETSPVGNVFFARWEDEKTYFLLPQGFEQFFTQTVYDLREKRIFSMNAASIRRLQLSTPEGSFEIENQGAQWIWKQPERMQWTPCPAGDAEALVEHLSGLFVKDFLENVTDEESGLSQASKIVLWSGADQSETLELGSEAVVRDAFYARKGGAREVLLVAREKLRLFMELFRALADDGSVAAGPLPPPASAGDAV